MARRFGERDLSESFQLNQRTHGSQRFYRAGKNHRPRGYRLRRNVFPILFRCRPAYALPVNQRRANL